MNGHWDWKANGWKCVSDGKKNPICLGGMSRLYSCWLHSPHNQVFCSYTMHPWSRHFLVLLLLVQADSKEGSSFISLGLHIEVYNVPLWYCCHLVVSGQELSSSGLAVFFRYINPNLSARCLWRDIISSHLLFCDILEYHICRRALISTSFVAWTSLVQNICAGAVTY
jgi:hypothetical protein